MLKHKLPPTYGAKIFVSALPGYPLEDQISHCLQFCEKYRHIDPEIIAERDATPFDPWYKRPTLERLLSGRYEKRKPDGSFEKTRLIVPVYECLSPRTSEFYALEDRLDLECALDVEAAHYPGVSWNFGMDDLQFVLGNGDSDTQRLLDGVYTWQSTGLFAKQGK